MPWNEYSVIDCRLLEGEGVTEVCRDFGVSCEAGYEIFNRYKEEGLEALAPACAFRQPVAGSGGTTDRRPQALQAHWGTRKMRTDTTSACT